MIEHDQKSDAGKLALSCLRRFDVLGNRSLEGTSEFADGMSANRPPYNHQGTIVVAGVWLAFYLIVAIHQFAV